MKRRSALGLVAVGLSTGCVGTWPQPTGPRGPPAEPEDRPREPGSDALRIGDWDFGETESGLLRVFGTVQNDGDATAQATVEAVVSAANQRYERTQSVEVPAGDTTEFDVEFDLEYETFVESGSIDLRLR